MCFRSRKREERGSGAVFLCEPRLASGLCAFLSDVTVELRPIPLPGRFPTLFSDPCEMSCPMFFQASLSPTLCNASIIRAPTSLLEYLASFFADVAIILCRCFLACLGKASARPVQSFTPFQCSCPIQLLTASLRVPFRCPPSLFLPLSSGAEPSERGNSLFHRLNGRNEHGTHHA
jgi:hypothetical protein